MAARAHSAHGARKATAPGTGGKGATPKPRAGSTPGLRMSTPSWPDVPGKTQPRDRSGGAPRTGHFGGAFNVNAKGF